MIDLMRTIYKIDRFLCKLMLFTVINQFPLEKCPHPILFMWMSLVVVCRMSFYNACAFQGEKEKKYSNPQCM